MCLPVCTWLSHIWQLFLAAAASGLGPWLTPLCRAPGEVLPALWAQPVPHAPLRLPGTSGFIRNKNNKQRVTLYCPAGFHPESSKHFTHQDSLVLSRGPRYPVMGTMGRRALSFPDRRAMGLGANRESSMVGNQVASRSVIEVKLD